MAADARKKTVSGVGYFYTIGGLNRWFAFCSLALLASLAWMILSDHNREWKRHQREFQGMERARAEAEIANIDADPDFQQRYAAAQAAVDAARAEMEQRRGDMEKARRDLRALAGTLYNADQNYRFGKAELDAARYEYEEALNKHPSHLEKAKREFERLERHVEEAREALDGVKAKNREAEAALAALTHAQDEAGHKMEGLLAERDRLFRRVQRLTPGISTALLNAPLLDYMQPTLKVQQAVLGEVKNDINFMSIPRVDRCVTCHQGVMKAGYEEAPQPYRSHPRPELFLSSGSPHPYERFGCTTCHLGRDRGTSFVNAAHTPDSDEEAERWHHERGWHKMHHWDYPMLPLRYAEAGCRKCHVSEPKIPGAEKLNHGIMLMEHYGCHGCHQIDGMEGLPKAGPNLSRVKGKLNKAWVHKWLRDPRSFNPQARMPRIFHNDNQKDEAGRRFSEVALHAIGHYLFQVSEEGAPLPAVPARGNAKNGAELVETIGCKACHTVGVEDSIHEAKFRSFGPNLFALGSKLDERWLFAWLKDPKHLSSTTRMPSLRLSDQEAADITAFLMSSRNEAFEREPDADYDPAALDSLMFDILKPNMLVSEAKAKVDAMPRDEKLMFVGQRMVAHQGCFGCHVIPGFENAQPIGTSLSDHGRKDVHQLDFGFVDIPATRHDWYYKKLENTRIFDQGREKTVLDRLKMPVFNFTHEEREAVVTALLSFSREDLDAGIKRQPMGRMADVFAGQRLVADRNCQGCHIIEGRGGEIAQAVAELSFDGGFAPPNLSSQGAKTQTDWLFAFLHNPSTVRPWMKARMPTFGFTDSEVNTLLRYFNALDRQDFPFQTYNYAKMDPAKLAHGKAVFTQYQCQLCHVVGGRGPAGRPESDWAPDLSLARRRLKPEWMVAWLLDPASLVPRTKMPDFFEEKQPESRPTAEAIRDYILTLGQ